MLDPAIKDFLANRREAWLKNKIKGASSDEEKAKLEREADDKFALAYRLPYYAKRAKQLNIVSHPAKFSHPAIKVIAEGASAVIAPTDNRRADGFLRTGNVDVELDVDGNAAALDVYAFLSIQLTDNQTILAHLEKRTLAIKNQFTIPDHSFEELEEGLLAIKKSDSNPSKTDGRIKQVYFPLNDDSYHLLSIRSPSSLMFKLKERINLMRFSDEAKDAREAKKKNEYHQNEYSEIFDLCYIGFGGAQPQNISVLNTQNKVSYLLLSKPPELQLRSIQPPRVNFFSNTLWVKNYQDDFQELQKLLGGDRNNVHIRSKRDWIVKNIIVQIVDHRVWMVRGLDAGWSDSENYESLPHYQKIWLDQKYVDNRAEETEWLESVKKDLARWFLNAFQKLVKGEGLEIGDDQRSHFKSVIDECQEWLK